MGSPSCYHLLEKLGLRKMMKTTPSKGFVIRINVILFAFFLVAYCTLFLRPFPSAYQEKVATSVLIRCSLRECHHKAEDGVKMKAVLEEQGVVSPTKHTQVRREKPKFLKEMGIRGMKIAAVNMEDEDLSEWEVNGDTITRVSFEKVSELFEWKYLFPEWIDEEQENEGYVCPEIPMPTFEEHGNLDIVVANLPCNFPEKGWARDIFRLQIHLIVANMAVKKGRRDWYGRTKIMLLSKCRPMLDMFRCDDLVRREGDWWYYEPDMVKLQQKVTLPMGSCRLALPLWGQDSARSKLRKSWIGDMSSSRFADTLWKEYSKSGAEKRADTLKNAPTSKALAEKAAAKKRPAGTSEAPPSKKAKGFTAKKRKTTRPVPKVVIELPAKEEAKEEPAEADSRALVAYTGPAEQPTPSQPDEVVILEDAGQSSQPDTAVDGSAFSGPVAQLVGQMPAAYRTASRSSGESYYSNVVRTLRVGGRPMSPSNKQTVVIPIRCTDESNLSDKGKGPAVDGSPSLSDDESSPAFGKMSSSDREKLKTELFKCFPEPYIKGLRGASSGHVGYMSQLAAEVRLSFSRRLCFILDIFFSFFIRPDMPYPFMCSAFCSQHDNRGLGKGAQKRK
ncbi:uncharacterized protein LOC104905847 isoform X1 [Beta vulgaris subsp. vulgaris]|uniref:uncharacterized protein LOC104905847 isoform X1 n=1 Tax=Beta vulgaris subsp. vulgaris TaxID=3555 RepID=UPI00254912A4|nr:uncharacterized protein LOC104905847 isoform X1 [Beta vulgaris subsp. vulgaris]